MIATTALSPALGVQVSGVLDVLDDAVVGRCLEALKWRGVLLIRGLGLDDEAQLAFSRKLGPVLAPAGREIFKVSLNPSVNPSAEYLKGTFHWHIDDTTNTVPAKATMLTARHVAMVGGGTQFANTYAAYENLSEIERKRFDGLRVMHTFEAAQRLVDPDPSPERPAALRTVPTHESALVWHRRDGRSSLVIGATADYIIVVVWDNTGMLHRALPYDPASERTMHRTTISGDEAWS